MNRSYGVGRYSPGEGDCVAQRHDARRGQVPVVTVPGRGSTALGRLFGGLDLHRALTDRGLVAIETDYASPTHWGNDTSVARVGAARSYIETTWAADDGGVLLALISMGSVAGLRWARANLASVKAIALLTPVVDVVAMHASNRSGWATEIATAHGGAPPAEKNPVDFADELAGIPIKVWYSTDDPVCLPAEVTAFATVAGAEMRSMGAISHTVGGMWAEESADFLAAHV